MVDINLNDELELAHLDLLRRRKIILDRLSRIQTKSIYDKITIYLAKQLIKEEIR